MQDLPKSVFTSLCAHLILEDSPGALLQLAVVRKASMRPCYAHCAPKDPKTTLVQGGKNPRIMCFKFPLLHCLGECTVVPIGPVSILAGEGSDCIVSFNLTHRHVVPQACKTLRDAVTSAEGIWEELCVRQGYWSVKS